MTTIETKQPCRFNVRSDGRGFIVTDIDRGRSIAVVLEDEERRALAAALDPGRTPGGQWTRDDLPRIASRGITHDRVVEHTLDAVVAHLNAHHPKPQPYDEGGVRGADSLLRRAECERDAAVARATLAEQERENWRITAINRAAPAVSRADIENQLRIAYESGNHPIERIRVATDAMCDLFGVEAEQAADPVEAKARVEADRRHSGDPNHAFIEGAVWAARHLNEQEATR